MAVEEIASRKDISLRDMQISAILKMLFLNKDLNNNDNITTITDDIFNQQEIIWKVLILDIKSTATISSVLRVNDLLKAGITVHSLIKQDRSPLPDVPAIYFVSPTKENIDIIVNDLKSDKYSEFYINFTSSLPRNLLEDLAQQVSITGKSDKIKQVYDQYLDFIVTEPELFSLEISNAYLTLNDPKTTEEEITGLCANIADGLFNTVLTINSIPIIRAAKGGPAEIIAEKLGTKLRDFVINTNSSSTSTLQGNDSLERGVLIILDRNIDFASMFSHSWIYQCMVFDIFKLSRNTVTIPLESKENGTDNNTAKPLATKKYDIEPNDFFWMENSHLPFPEAAENVEAALNTYKEEAAEITRKTGVTNISDLDPNSNNDTVQIQEVVKKLPELTAKKNTIDTHMNIFAALLSQLESKSLDTFFEVEQDPGSTKTRSRFLDILKDGKTNNLEDKLRSFIVLYLTSTTGLPKDFVQNVENYFKENDYDINALKYVYKLREFMQLSNMSLQNKSLEDGSDSAFKPSNLTLSGIYGLTEGKLQGGVGSLISGIKKLLPEKKTIPITNVVDAIMDPLNSSQKNLETTDSYLYIDPKITRGSHTRKPKRQSYNKSLVFVVGGGNYLEYQNLQEWAHSQLHNPKKVMYGSTAITTPAEFLNEISRLGASNSSNNDA
ncbi:AFI_G0010420.mRNA.1.CDS.1 [Saccharomyces cerevisiae]|nr:syntaxin-binding protein [Saccharomyces cerevisiae]PTN21518.1 syntaxin-binding protein [Saccharomyces cerevisiae]CAI4342628.1 CAS_1a_G0010430.mRNA.1.CDS.1 [Saccharomyces cerevisiae]CAI4343166.1 AFI_G0010420.mRNA.1.CDS.1 [Saccharomyces cerevisiae]CAI6563852.1 AFI_G0010420.mRNA.1.CDS.1 [Saccharomyces cerevisiae]